MVKVAHEKRQMITKALLKRAYRALPRPEKTDADHFNRLESLFKEYLELNKSEDALNTLEALSHIVPTRGGFWKDMIRLAENMNLKDRRSLFQKIFLELRTPPSPK